MSSIRCIGICTGGGDAPGLNAVIRAAVKAAFLKYKWKVIGIPDGFDGLIWPEKSYELTLKDVSGILPRGGTILGTTNRGTHFRYCTVEDLDHGGGGQGLCRGMDFAYGIHRGGCSRNSHS